MSVLNEMHRPADGAGVNRNCRRCRLAASELDHTGPQVVEDDREVLRILTIAQATESGFEKLTRQEE